MELAVLKRMEDALLQRIDAVAWRGFAFVETWELNAWYGAERIGKGVWRDLRDRFAEVAYEGSELLYCDRPDGVLLLDSQKVRNISSKTGEGE